MLAQKPKYYEVPLTDLLFRKASAKLYPLSGTFELSPVCNFSCRMCYVRKTQKEVSASQRPILTAGQWLDIARQAHEQGMLYLLLTGGEPLLWPDFWELYEKLIHMGFLISINTNGSLIDDAAIERFRKLPPARINITLYGASDETYEALCRAKHVFSKVDHAITGLREAGISVKLNCSLTPYNVGDLKAMLNYAHERDLIIDANAYMFPPLRRDKSMIGRNDRFTPKEAAYYHMLQYRLQNGEEQYREFLDQIQKGLVDPPGLDESCIDPIDGKIRCRAGKAAFWITWDGWMTPCGMTPEPKVDLMKLPFAEAWKNLTEESSQVKLSGTCTKCPDEKICHSCMAMAMAETGSPSGIPKYLCQMVQEMKRLAAEELNQLDLAETADKKQLGGKENEVS